MQTLTFKGYIGKFVSPTKEGVDEVCAFLNAGNKLPQMYSRHRKSIEASVFAGLFFGIWKEIPNRVPMLIATIAIFLHSTELIAITQDSDSEYGICVEQGACLRRKEREGDSYPRGIFMPLLMATPLIQLFYTTGRKSEAEKCPILADVVVCNADQGEQSVRIRNFLCNKPHNWEELGNPSPQLLTLVRSSVSGPDVNRAKDYNRFFISSVPAMAEIVLNALTTGLLKSEHKGILYEAKIDLSGLSEGLKEALPIIIKNKEFFQKIDKHTSFTEARNLFEQHIIAANLESWSETLPLQENLEEQVA